MNSRGQSVTVCSRYTVSLPVPCVHTCHDACRLHLQVVQPVEVRHATLQTPIPCQLLSMSVSKPWMTSSHKCHLAAASHLSHSSDGICWHATRHLCGSAWAGSGQLSDNQPLARRSPQHDRVFCSCCAHTSASQHHRLQHRNKHRCLGQVY